MTEELRGCDGNELGEAPRTEGGYLEGWNGVRLASDERGDPGATTVVLLHGGGQTRHAWAETAERLARQGYHAVTVDLRGHGDSDRAPGGDYRREAFAGDVACLARQFSPAPVMVGASLGGISALLAQAEHPPPVASALVLVDIATRIEPSGAERVVSFMTANPEGFASLEEAADAIAAYLPHRRRPRDVRGLEKNLRRGSDGRYRWHWDPRVLEGDRSLTGSRDQERLRHAARKIDVPCLLVRGRESDMLTEDGVAEFLALVPHASYVDVHGAGHMVAGDRNDVFADAVVEFLEGLEGTRRARTA